MPAPLTTTFLAVAAIAAIYSEQVVTGIFAALAVAWQLIVFVVGSTASDDGLG